MATHAAPFDRHAAYEAAVQGVAAPLGLLEEKFRCALLRPLQVLREDFCGTAALLHRFVTEDDVDDSTRLGLGVDIDPEVIEWGRRRRTFGPRTLLLAADVFDAPKTFLGSRPDAVLALNHSYFVFHTEAELDKYFASVYAALPDEVGGMLMVDAYGGRTAHTVGRTTRTVDDCPGVKRYFRVVQDWNPTTRMCDWCIDFEDNASVVHRAFRYRWRVWTVDQVAAAMTRVGFSNVQPLFTPCDGDNSPASVEVDPKKVDGTAAGRDDRGDATFAAGQLEHCRWVVWVAGTPLEYDISAVQRGGERVVLGSTDPSVEIELPVSTGAPKIRVAVVVEVSRSPDAPSEKLWSGSLWVNRSGGGGSAGPSGAERGDDAALPTSADDADDCVVWAGSIDYATGNGMIVLSDICVAVLTAKLTTPPPATPTAHESEAAAQGVSHGVRDLDVLENWYAYILAFKPSTS